MPKPLTVQLLQKEASSFAKAQSKHAEPIDTSTLQPRLQSVRRDYFRALHRSPSSPAKASRRVAWVRQMIACLAYFRHGHAHGDTEH